MKQTWTSIYIIFLIGFLCQNLTAQSLVFPGDINNNGVVSASDLLYLGNVYGKTGAQRTTTNADWFAQPISTDWQDDFPNGLNNAYADANGDGVIDEADILSGIIGNFGKTHGSLLSEGYLNGIIGTHPQLKLSTPATAAFTNSTLHVDLELGDTQLPVNDFYGISFLVSFSNNEAVDLSQGISFNVDPNAWIDPLGSEHRKIAMPTSDGKVQFSITRINQIGINSGGGSIGSFYIIIEDIVMLSPSDSLTIAIDSIKLVDKDLNTFPVARSSISLPLLAANFSNPFNGPCPAIVDPVCGNDGVTYQNSCYALQAGVTIFTSGVCYNNCINPSQIFGEEVACPAIYEPVCGCNNVTYPNSCKADAAGLSSYTNGPCQVDNNCYNFAQTGNAGSVSIDPNTGVMNPNCGNDFSPVCGCDGLTYQNPCLAEASGVQLYAQGPCGTCIDPNLINPNILCANEYDPVCGCNGVTYINRCFAEAAGVTSFNVGTCGSSVWCNEATPIQCGDFLPNETNVGAGNQISQYLGCLNTTLVGPDKVYVVQKTTPGDLQIGLEITTPNLDLDLFLLDGNCNAVNCLDASHTDNTQTNNEGILYEDAPIGTYYIVVDGQYAASQGNFRLEVSCAYLDCSNAVDLECGVSYNSNNITGDDNVSAYQCGNVLNVENNGPERVHTFTLIEPGEVHITLGGLSANLELFLLDACDNSSCLKYSQNGGTQSENIDTYLDAGTYYVIVDGYNGATSDYKLMVECEAGCGLDLYTSTTNADCAANNGTISLSMENGTAPYIVRWQGLSSGTFATYQPSAIITNLAGGNYLVEVIDANNCKRSEVVMLNDNGNLSFSTSTIAGGCNSLSGIQVNIAGTVGGYWIQLAGPVNQNIFTNNPSYTFINLPGGTYSVLVQDGNGCTDVQDITLSQSSNGLNFNVTPTAATCNQLGYLSIAMLNGQAPFGVTVDGPVMGNGIAQGANFTVQNLPGGTYDLTIVDANGCQAIQQISVPNYLLDISATAQNGVCGTNGGITVSINSGTPNYTVAWSGPVSGSSSTSTNTFQIPNLPTGNYNINVTDGAGCTDYQVVTVNNSSPGLHVDVSTSTASCNALGSVWMNMNNGTAPFTIAWYGPQNGNATTNNFFYDITGLNSGYYTINVMDANNCSFNTSVNIGGSAGIVFNANPGSVNCGQNGDIDINITAGNAPYFISWSGPVQGNVATSNNNYNISNLPSGTYNLIVSDATGCSSSESVYLNTTNSLSLSAIGNNGLCGDNGTISVNISGGNGNYSVTWSGPTFGSFNTTGNALIIPNLPSGIYTINVMDTAGCGATQNVTLSNGTGSLNVGYSPVGGSCGQTGYIGVSLQNGNAPFDIAWSGPSSGSATTSSIAYTIPNLVSGMYFITVTDDTGCEDYQGLWLVNGDDFTVNAMANHPVCGQTTGSIDVNITDGQAPYTVSYTGSVSGNFTANNDDFSINSLPSGTYTITIFDNNGCSEIEQTTLYNSGGNIGAWLTSNAGSCGQNGSISVEVNGGTAPYHITWSGAASGSFNFNGTLTSIPNLPSGYYSIDITDANGCTFWDGITLTNGGNTLGAWLTPNVGSCGQNGSISVEVNGGTAPYNIAWSGAASGAFNFNGTLTSIPNLPTGTYSIDITDANGCTFWDSATVTNGGGNLDVWLTPNPGTCGQNGSISIEVNNGTAPYHIAWSGATSGSFNFNGNLTNMPNLPSGYYSIDITDANGCTFWDDVTLTNGGNNLSLSTSTNSGACGQNGSINLTIGGGVGPYTISWSGPITSNGSTNNNSFTIPNLTSGTYTIQVQDGSGCSKTKTVQLSNGGNNLGAWLTANPGACGQSGSVSVEVNGGTAPYHIAWSGAATGSFNFNGTLTAIPNLPSGYYSIDITDANGCTFWDDITLTNGANNLNLWTNTSPGVCGINGSIDLTINGGTAPYTITWSGAANGIASSNTSNYTISNLPSGTFSIQVEDNNGCTKTKTLQLDNTNNNLGAWLTANPGACGQNGSISVEINGGTAPYTVAWSGAAGGSFTVNGTLTAIPNLPDGYYSVDISDANGCTFWEGITLTGGAGNINIHLITNSNTCAQNGSIDVQILDGDAPYTIAWSGPVSGNTTSNSNDVNLPNLPEGYYDITVTDDNMCTDTETIYLANGYILDFTTTVINGGCGQPSSIDLEVNSGTLPISITWSGPVSGNASLSSANLTIPNLPAGTYMISGIDADGCQKSLSVQIINTNNISATVTPNNGSCGTLGTIDVNFGGGNPPYTVSWSGAATGSVSVNGSSTNIPNLPNGNYTIEVIDNNGCSKTKTTTLSNGSDLAFAATAINADCGSMGTIAINITNGNAPYTVTYSGVATGSQQANTNSFNINNLISGSYNLIVTDAAGCSSNQSVLLENGTNLDFSATPIDGNCGQNGSMNITITDGTPPFSISWTGVSSGTTTITDFSTTIPSLSAGTYTFSVLDNAGCSNSTSVTIYTTGYPSVVITASDILCNGLNNGSATANPSAGAPPYSYAWSTGVSTQTIDNLGAGNYTVTITDNNGCTAVASASITQSNMITVDKASSNITCFGANDGSILVSGWGGTPLYTYEWSTGLIETETTPNGGSLLNNLTAGTYTVTVTDANGCTVIASETITEPSPIIINASASDAGCGQNNGTATANPVGGITPYTYTWSTGATTQSITNLAAGTYTVQIFDANFCTQTETVTVGTNGNHPTASYSYTNDGLTVNFTNSSSGNGAVFYDFGDGSTSNANNPSHTFCSEGTYYVCQTVTNGCGTDDYCHNITVSIPTNYIVLEVGNINPNSGSTALIPVTIQDNGMLVSLAGSFQLTNPSIGNITDVTAGIIHPTFNAGMNTFSFFESSGNGVLVSSGDILFYIEVQITGTSGANSDITITNNPLAIEVGLMVGGQTIVSPHAVLCGEIHIPNMANAAGWVQTYWGEGINEVNIAVENMAANFNDTYMTGETGEYHFFNMPMADTYTLEPTKNNDPNNGLSTFALFIGQQYILGNNPSQITSPYQVIAGDANCNGSFTTVDLFLIQQVLIGTAPAFNSCPSWVFMPTSFAMPQPWTNTNIFDFPQMDTIHLMSDTTANFIGVKVGDVLGQANPANLITPDDRSGDELVLMTKNRSAKAGETINLAIKAKDFAHIASMQFALNYDSEQLQLTHFQEANLLSPALGLFEGQVRMSWFETAANGLSLTQEEQLFHLEFQVMRDIEDISTLLSFEQEDFSSIAHQPDGTDYTLVLAFEETTTDNTFDLLQNTPNPFVDYTQIQFELPVAMPAEILIQNSRGELMKTIARDFAGGLNQVRIAKENMPSGVYYYTLKAGDFVKTQRMVVL